MLIAADRLYLVEDREHFDEREDREDHGYDDDELDEFGRRIFVLQLPQVLTRVDHCRTPIKIELLQVVHIPEAESLATGIFMGDGKLYAPDWCAHRVHTLAAP